MILKAHNAAFFLMYALGDLIRRSTSEARSLAISGEAIAPRVHRARPTTNCVLLLRSLLTKKNGELEMTIFCKAFLGGSRKLVHGKVILG